MPRLRVIALLLALAFAGCEAVAGGGGGESADRAQVGRVVRVVDGDTIHVRLGGREEKVRYIGVDTPESVKSATPGRATATGGCSPTSTARATSCSSTPRWCAGATPSP